MSMKKIIFTVTTDLTYDQRMKRICTSVSSAGYSVVLVGRKKKSSLPLNNLSYKQHRLNCIFEKGKLFYAEYNIRLFFHLLFNRFDIVCSIDLDTILPGYFASKIKNKPQVYDAHEYFTEMEEVVSRPFIKKCWQWIEKVTVPNIKYAYTVSDGYARLFKEKYGLDFTIVRNATVLKDLPEKNKDVSYILYQGSVNVGRGLEPLILAMKKINMPLYICGNGDVFNDLTEMVKQNNLESKVKFCGYVKPEQLIKYTANAYMGITFFTNNGLSNQYSLANRFFDYMHAGVPQIAMNYPEYSDFNKKYKIAELINKLSPDSIANAINKLIEDKDYYLQLHANSLEARKEFNWQNEEKKLLDLYNNIP
jgi:glycosyltransferase involved in cell wall biosynthesis